MAEYSRLFTDPDASAYGPNALESNLDAQSTTNPFAIPHAIAARLRAQQAREQYGDALAAHDQRAVEGSAGLNANDAKMGYLKTAIEKGLVPLSQILELAGDPNAQRSDILDLSRIDAQGKIAAVKKTDAEANQLNATAGYEPTNLSSIADRIGMGKYLPRATTGEREAAAKANADAGKVTVQDIETPDASKPNVQRTTTFKGTADQIRQQRDAYNKANNVVQPDATGPATVIDPNAALKKPQSVVEMANKDQLDQPEAPAGEARVNAETINKNPQQMQGILNSLGKLGVKTEDLKKGGASIDAAGNIRIRFRTKNGEAVIRIDPQGNEIK